jgi:hypothetical protein
VDVVPSAATAVAVCTNSTFTPPQEVVFPYVSMHAATPRTPRCNKTPSASGTLMAGLVKYPEAAVTNEEAAVYGYPGGPVAVAVAVATAERVAVTVGAAVLDVVWVREAVAVDEADRDMVADFVAVEEGIVVFVAVAVEETKGGAAEMEGATT